MKFEDYSPPFTKIGPYYDQLMSFVNYPAWVSYIEKILILNTINEREILDLACGTGICLELWLKKGYTVIGLDASPGMLEICRKRLIDYPGFRLIAGDMRNFTLPNRVPIITCLYDSFNYLLTEVELFNCFKCVYDCLTDNGIFIFDMNTIHTLQDGWGNQTFTRRDDSISSVWANTFDPQTLISSLKLTLTIYENGSEKVLKEFHQERGYALIELGNLLSNAGFKFSLYRHLTFIPAGESDLRIMGVARISKK